MTPVSVHPKSRNKNLHCIGESNNYLKTHLQQECIPVGCVPAARRPYAGVSFPGGSAWSRVGLPGLGVCLVLGGGLPGLGGSAWSRGGVCLVRGGLPGPGERGLPGPGEGGLPGPGGSAWSGGVSAWSGRVCLVRGRGVCLVQGGVCLVGGVSAWSGGVCLVREGLPGPGEGGLPGPGGSAWSGGVCLVRGGSAWSGGVCLVPGGVVSQHALRQNPPL